MPTYFFDLFDYSELERDDIGEELADKDRARERAVEVAMELAADQIPDDSCLICTVRDIDDKTIVTVKLTLSVA